MIRNLFILNFSELFERMTYYGVRSILILFLLNEIAVDRDSLMSYYGNFTLAIYVIAVFSGLIADSTRKPALIALIGNILSSVGVFTLAFAQSQPVAVLGMTLLAIGSGTFKPAVIGALYRASFHVKHRLDLIMTIFYAAVNLGAFLGPTLIAGAFSSENNFDYRSALLLSGCLSVIPNVLLVIGYKNLLSNDIEYNNQSLRLSTFSLPKIAIYFVLTIIFWLVYQGVPSVTGAASVSSFQIFGAISGLIFLGIMIPLNLVPNFKAALKISIGLVLAALACFLTGFLTDNPIVVILVFALCEALIYPVVMSQVVLCASPRFTATFISLFMALSLLTNTLSGAIDNVRGNSQIAIVYLLGAVLVGLVIAILVIDAKEKSSESQVNQP